MEFFNNGNDSFGIIKNSQNRYFWDENSQLDDADNVTSNYSTSITGDYNGSKIRNFYGHSNLFSDETSQCIQFILGGILLSIVALLGIFGNVLSISVLAQRKMASSLSAFLISLSMCDLLVCVLMVCIAGIPQILIKANSASSYLAWLCLSKRYLFPIVQTAQLGSTYFTVVITIERFIVVCFPLKSRSICTFRNAVYALIIIPIFCVIVHGLLYYTYSTRTEFYDSANQTCVSNSATEMSTAVKRIRLIMYAVITYLFPMITVIVVNVFIVKEICQKNAERDVLNQHQLKEIKLTNMLIVVVLVYVLCNIFRVLNSITNNIYDETYAEVVSLTNFLVTLNSAVNYLIYCAYGKSFRQSFVKLFCYCDKRKTRMVIEETTTELSVLKSIRRLSKSVINSFGS